MKILVALSRFPLPLDKGDKLRAYYQLRELSKNNDLYLVCLIRKQPAEAELNRVKEFCKEIILVRLSSFQIGVNLMGALFNTLPFQVNYFRSSEMKTKIRELIESKNIDLCFVQLIRLVENIPFRLKTKYFIDYMDSLSSGMVNRHKYSSWFEKWLVGIEAKSLLKYEEKVFSFFNGASIITQADAECFPLSIKKELIVVPNGVDESFFKDYNSTPKKYDLIFTGNMGYHPNVLACKFLVNEILPVLKQKCPDIRICLAGTHPAREVMKLANKNIEVTGYVKDIREYLGKARLFVAPLFSGSGLQNKLLESMACGLPTITTPSAAKALGAQEGKELFVCKTKEEFAEQIYYLLDHEKKALDCGRNGLLFVKDRFKWQESNRLLENEFFRILK